jgi:hypothetical protein
VALAVVVPSRVRRVARFGYDSYWLPLLQHPRVEQRSTLL